MEIQDPQKNKSLLLQQETSSSKEAKKYVEWAANLLKEMKVTDNSRRAYSQRSGISIDDALEKRKGDLENDARAQDIFLKKWTLIILFIFLALETLVIFSFSFFQATKIFHFQLEDWSFKLLVGATISQITYMVQVAVKHLFPDKK